MPNLIESFGGKRRFYDKFNGSMFKGPDGGSYFVRPVADDSPGMVACHKLLLTASGRVSAQTERADIPEDFFKDMSTFGLPDLGWRSYAAGKVLIYFQKSDSTYHRGTSISVLRQSPSEFTSWLSDMGEVKLGQETTANKIMYNILNPEFLSLREGLSQIREGHRASFAVSHKLAVTPDVTGGFALWYKQRRVGTVSESGDVETQNTYALSILQEAL